jgi:hypothetical protein
MSLILHHELSNSLLHVHEIQISNALHLEQSNLKGLHMSDRIEPTITVLGGSKIPVPEAVAKPNSIDGQMESVLMAWVSPDEAIENRRNSQTTIEWLAEEFARQDAAISRYDPDQQSRPAVDE